jgi:hypothetical protein
VCGKAAPIQITVLTFIVGRFQDRQICHQKRNVGEILARFNTEEQVRAAFPDYQAECKDYLTQKRYSLKTSKHENIHVLQTAQPRRLFYFNNELNTTLLKERQTRTSTSLMKKIKKEIVS